MTDSQDKYGIELAPEDTQGHGNHWGCLVSDIVQDVVQKMPAFFQEAELKNHAKDIPARCVDEENAIIDKVTISCLEYMYNSYLGVNILILHDFKNERNSAISFYPMICNGSVGKFKLVGIQEWQDGLEAYLTVEDIKGERSYTFLDMKYAAYKKQYELGKVYEFELSILASFADILAAEKRVIKLTGEAARKLSDEDSVEVQVDTLRTLMQRNQDYPHDLQFQAPIDSIVKLGVLEQGDVYRFEISPIIDIDTDEEFMIPCYVNKSNFEGNAEVGEPLQGAGYLLGKVVGLTDDLTVFQASKAVKH